MRQRSGLAVVACYGNKAASAQQSWIMAEIVNLRRVRRARARQLAGEQAAAARAEHGVAPARRRAGKAEQQRMERRLDATLLTQPASPEHGEP